MAAKRKTSRKKRTAPRRKSRPHKRLKSKGRRWWPLILVLILAIAVGAYWYLSTRGPIPPLELPPLPSSETPAQSASFEVFFGNSEEDPESEDCSVVYPVERMAKETSAVARLALEELLAGPTPEERALGYYTSINPGVTIRHLAVSGGEAVVDLSREVETGVAGSCQVEAIRAQLERTLMQFDTIRNVSLTVDGEAPVALQP